MSTGYAGLVMCVPHLYNEISLRIYGNSDSQSELIADSVVGLCKTITSLGNNSSVFIYDPVKNNSTYVEPRSAMMHIKNTIGNLLQHVCVIGEEAANLLRDMYFYVAMIDDEDFGGGTVTLLSDQISETFL